MPDNDVVPRGVYGRWRQPARMLIGEQDSSVVGLGMAKALASDITEQGLRSPLALVARLRESVTFSDSALAESARQDYLRQCGDSALGRAVLEEARVLEAVQREGLVYGELAETTQSLIEGGLRRHVEQRLVGPDVVQTALVQSGRPLPQIEAHIDACFSHADLPELARRTIAADGGRVRPPRPKRLDASAFLGQEI